MAHLKAHELRQKSRAELLDELATLEKKLFELRGQKSAQASGAKMTEILLARRDVARVKSVLMQQQRESLKAKYDGKKLIPKDIRAKVEKSVRNALAEKYAVKKTTKQARRGKFLRPVKFAVKA